LFDIVYAGPPHLRFEGYACLYDFRNAPTLSTANAGRRVTASFDLAGGLTAMLDGEFACSLVECDVRKCDIERDGDNVYLCS
jgi:hypothetical protein